MTQSKDGIEYSRIHFKKAIYSFVNLINKLKDEGEIIRQKDERIEAGEFLRKN